ncbi:MAG: hypothetical protein RUMPE_01234 [Eubacteriales bacterium SKADARSKE-1]|nr:hypothetical protein [Eubacteriales bacterium SKADARSKE-1]
MKIEIKQATLSDVNTLSKIHAASWKVIFKGYIPQGYLDNLKDDHWVNFFYNGLQSGNLKALIAYDKNIPLGCITYARSGSVPYGPETNKKYSNFGEIVSIYLIEKYFHKGIGTALLNAAIDDLNTVGLKNNCLWVLKENISAQKFYLKNGFDPTDIEYNFKISGKSLTDILFVKISKNS